MQHEFQTHCKKPSKEFGFEFKFCYNFEMSNLETIENEIENLNPRERRVLKSWLDRLEGQSQAIADPAIRHGNGQKAKGLTPRIQLPNSAKSLSETVSELREARNNSL